MDGEWMDMDMQYMDEHTIDMSYMNGYDTVMFYVIYRSGFEDENKRWMD